eukprot:188103-Rhodomonas_salina.1
MGQGHTTSMDLLLQASTTNAAARLQVFTAPATVQRPVMPSQCRRPNRRSGGADARARQSN